MEPVLQINEGRKAIHSLITAQTEAMDERMVSDIQNSGLLFMQETEAEGLEDRMNAEQIERMRHYQSKQERFTEELRELEEGRGTQEGEKDYQYKLLQAEQNKMALRLMQASVLGRETAGEQIKIESLEKIVFYRQKILENCQPQSILWCFHKRQLEKEQAEYEMAADGLKLRILTTATLDKIKAERKKKEEEKEKAGKKDAEDPAKLMQEFLDADFSTQALGAGYVIENLDTCLHNAEMVWRLSRMVFTGDDAARVIRKLEAVREYPNVVESALWEYGLTINYDAFQIKEIDPNDETFARRRREYLDHGAIRFYLDARRYKQFEDGEEADEARRQGARLTRVEERLRALEAKLGITILKEEGMHITRFRTRNFIKVGQAGVGDVIRASAGEAQGRREHLLIKNRFYQIYLKYKVKLREKLKSSAEQFERLQSFVEAYVNTNRAIFEDRAKAEEKEANALRALKSALAGVQKSAVSKCGKYAAILLGFLSDGSSGYLEVPFGTKPMYVKDEKIGLGSDGDLEYRDCRDMPLFTHRPNIKDIEQGGLGDCYLLSGLISVVDQNPEEIMNIMKDNGDGTVTVCFKPAKIEKTGAGEKTVYAPYYVTVEKTIPVLNYGGPDAFSQGSLWVKMMEKAYAASGLHKLNSLNKEKKKNGEKPFTFLELQQAIGRGDVDLDYNDIEGGFSGRFISLLLGKEREITILDKNRADSVADKIGSMLPPINEPAWDQRPATKFGHERYDSIVYEYIKRQDVSKAQRFLRLQKPAPQNRKKAAGQQYLREKNELQEYRRSCMLHLDIVDTLIRSQRGDIWKMDSEGKIRKWYGKIKKWFAHYVGNGGGKQNKKDKIIESVGDTYSTDEFYDSFLKITEAEFNITVDILQERHLSLFKKRQSSRPKPKGREVKETGQILDSHYTAGERKLYEKIEESLRSGAYVTFGTRVLAENHDGKNGESVEKGLVGEHDYMLMNTRKIMVNGEEQLYFVVMNPWAETGVFYKVGKDHTTRHAAEKEKEEGVFLLDLKTFARVVDSWEKVPA